MTPPSNTVSEARLTQLLAMYEKADDFSPFNYESDTALALRELLALRSPSPDAAMGEWRAIESAPKGRKLILGYRNALGKWRTVTGCYYERGELDFEPEDMDEGDVNGAGWYEDSDSLDEITFTREPPTHWMPLPVAPYQAKVST